MKTLKILVAILFAVVLFSSCQKEDITPTVDVFVEVYGTGEFIVGYRLTSEVDSLGFDIWHKEKYFDGEVIQIPNVEINDTLQVGTWGNRVKVNINDVQRIDTTFTGQYSELILPISE